MRIERIKEHEPRALILIYLRGIKFEMETYYL